MAKRAPILGTREITCGRLRVGQFVFLNGEWVPVTEVAPSTLQQDRVNIYTPAGLYRVADKGQAVVIIR